MKYENLGNIADLINNRVNNFDGFKKYIDTGSIIDNEIKEFSLVDYSNKPSRADLVIPELSVLFARMKSTIKVLIADRNMQDNYIFSTGFAVLKPKSSLNPFYLAHYLKTNFFNNTKDKLCTGATQKAIRNSEIENIKIPLPSLPEQKQIVEILDKADSIRQKRKQAINLLDEYLRSTFLEMFGDPVKNEKGWNKKTIPQIALKEKYAVKRGPFGGSLKKEIFVKKGYLIYEQYHAINDDFSMARYFITEEKYNELEMFKVKPGDLIISCSGVTLGRIAEIPKTAMKGIINQALLKISLDNRIINNTFFKFVFKHPAIQNKLFGFSRGSGIPNFPPMTEVNLLHFPVPPINLQNHFAEIVQKVESIKSKMQESLKEMDNHFNSLLNKFFNN